MAHIKIYFALAVSLSIALTLTACGIFGPGATRVDMLLQSSPNLNPNAQGRPSPVVVRIYEMDTADAFNTSDFFGLYDNEASILGQNIQSKKELEVKPNEKLRIRREAKPESKYIGIIVAYRDLDNARWRASIPLRMHKQTRLLINLGSLSVTITDLDKKDSEAVKSTYNYNREVEEEN